MNTVDRLTAEVEEMEKLINPEDDNLKADAEENVEVVDAPTPDVVEAIEPNTEVPEKVARTNWKKKFEEASRRTAGLKASSDQFKYQTRQEIKELRDTIESLKASATQVAPVDIFADVVTEEDRNTIGNEAVDVMKKITEKANKSQVDPLKAQIAKLQKEREEARVTAHENDAKQEYNSFLTRLNSVEPHWQKINSDPRFLTFMNDVDVASGYTKATLFQRAENARDVERVAGYMKEFKDSLVPVNKLEELVGPTGQSAPAVVKKDKKGEMIPESFVTNFENQVIRGLFKNKHKEAEQIQLKIEKALREGRVDFGR